jgi:hypothetical protein
MTRAPRPLLSYVIPHRHGYDGKFRLDSGGCQPQIVGSGERPAATVLHEFLESNRVQIIARTKAKVAARMGPCATEAELTHGIPLFFDQLIDTLKRSTRQSDEMNATATKHGDEMLRLGFTVGQVVHDYGDVCHAVTD